MGEDSREPCIIRTVTHGVALNFILHSIGTTSISDLAE
jgi:hypothetical protein